MKALLPVAMMTAGIALAAPEVSNVQVKDRSAGGISVSYTLAGAPAVVWMDVQTNGPSGWASIGADAIYGDGFSRGAPSGDANVVVLGNGDKEIVWLPHRTWPNHRVPAGQLRVELRAYAADNAPQYMGVDLVSGAVRFFPSESEVPGGVKARAWRTTRMLFRRIAAHGVTWISGDPFFKPQSQVSLIKSFVFPHDFYAAVFETTQRQWKTLCGDGRGPYIVGDKIPQGVDPDLLPMESASFRHIRETDGTVLNAGAENEAYMYPNPPCPDSFLGRLRNLTVGAAFPDGIDFDLPGEAQWEYVCRAGNDTEHWGEGSLAVTGGEISSMPGRCLNSPETAGVMAPAECGSYAPNAWGIYDMHGNVFEFCLDWFVSSLTVTGDWLVNANGKDIVSDPGSSVSRRVRRGGWYGIADTYALSQCRVNTDDDKTRSMQTPAETDARCGFRVFCRAGLW